MTRRLKYDIIIISKRGDGMNDIIVTEYTNLLKRKVQIETALSALPHGYISHKTINGKQYSYLQSRAFGKMGSTYLKSDEAEKIAEQLAYRKQLESDLPELDVRLSELERAARLIGKNMDRKLMLLKISMGMDEIDKEQKERSASFANAMNAIEGVAVSEQTKQAIADWQNGSSSYLSVFETVLRRYGFPVEV